MRVPTVAACLILALACGVAFAAAAPEGGTAPPGPKLVDSLAPLGFLLGQWEGTGTGAPGASAGGFTFEPEMNGNGILRRGFNDSPSGHHEDLMVIYPAPRGGLRAVYLDVEGHVIEYSVTRAPEAERVEFLSDELAGSPRYRLTYAMQPDSTVLVSFAVAPPGSAEFRTYIEGKSRRR